MNCATPAKKIRTGASATWVAGATKPPNTAPAIHVPVANPNSASVAGSATVAEARPSRISISPSGRRESTGPAGVQDWCSLTSRKSLNSAMSAMACLLDGSGRAIPVVPV